MRKDIIKLSAVALGIVISLIAAIVMPKSHVHNYKKEYVSATCTERGYVLHTCDCGDSYKDNYTPIKHNYVKKVIPPTCLTEGYTQYKCKCGKSYKDSIVAKKGHSFIGKTVLPTQNSQGYYDFKCSCGESYKDNYYNHGETQNINGEKLYSFGVLSDLHLKDVNFGADPSNSVSDYQRALTYFKQNGASFISIAGDIIEHNVVSNSDHTQDMLEWTSELELFKKYNDLYFDKEIYACTGNHDASMFVGGNGLAEKVTTYKNGNMTAEQVWTEITGRPINYVIERNGDVFIYFSMYAWNYVNFCREQDIDWLETQLKKYKDKRVFLFSHLPLPNTFDISEGLNVSEGAGRSLEMKALVESYYNVVWFTGHTSQTLYDEFDESSVNPNTYQKDSSAFMIHSPSCSYLRRKGAYDDHEGSQGLWIDVYSDKIIVKGIDFTLGTLGEFIPLINYAICI